ncbi:hypothetical protein CHLRE_06g264000v5 [Chlamydomonas reinhardtii]|uniref:Uncharacterized protein n=1 Tax=Chlamydomonas reinhardtii TaxID=3055 RepID=A8HX13_CHLRE|nr:uncharacterized protein CHLRE_06g264000v5 [Chlamydomonas reinhardtii]PNW81873.1 hypothetical protein CHLRE_06g264000v5 [Chlamydomonas reinhardtii]|eukprot:XP_001696563.1 predicted protein [Chlamydomonas reinhardtii]
MATIDGVKSSAIGIEMQEAPARKWTFDSFQFFGLTTWFIVLYSFYIGFFALLLKIALEVRKDNYMHLSSRLTGHPLTADAYTTPWLWLQANPSSS